MRLLIIFEKIHHEQTVGKVPYRPAYDLHLETGKLRDDFSLSVFDYDVTFVNIVETEDTPIQYYASLPKLVKDINRALDNGKIVVIFPGSRNFSTEKIRDYANNVYGEKVFNLLARVSFGEMGKPLLLNENEGTDIRPTGIGKAKVFENYFKLVPQYFQIIEAPVIPPNERLAVVGDTDIVVGCEINHSNGGKLVILPPPIIGNNYIYNMSILVDLGKYFYEKIQRRIPVGDTPEWVEPHKTTRSKKLTEELNALEKEIEKYQLIEYALYGTGDKLQESVTGILEDLGLEVDPQPKGANIDLKAKHPNLKIGFAIEVTGTRGTINKKSNKTTQAWTHVQEVEDTPEEGDKLIILANTQIHLAPSSRTADSFTRDVVSLAERGDILLLSTVQLYRLWKEKEEGNKKPKDILAKLYSYCDSLPKEK